MYYMANNRNDTAAFNADCFMALCNNQKMDSDNNIATGASVDGDDDDNNTHYYYLMCATIGAYILENNIQCHPCTDDPLDRSSERDDKKFIIALFYGYWFLGGGSVII